MSSVTISEVIILIAATILAGSFATYLVFYGNLVQNSVAISIDAVRQQMNIKVKIVYATINESEHCYIIYAKNVGYLPIHNSSFSFIDLYVGPYRKASLYRYNPNGGVGYYTVEDGDGDGVWEVGETAVLKAKYDASTFSEEPLYEAKIYISNGVGDSYLFTPPP